MRKLLLLFLVPLFLFVSCNKDKRGNLPPIGEIKKTANLGTVKFEISKLIIGIGGTGGGPEFFRKFKSEYNRPVFVADSEAEIIAGIDIEKIDPSKITVDPENNISITLPPVEILNFSYPPDKVTINQSLTDRTKVFEKQTITDIDGFFREAELDIRKNFQRLGIYKEAEKKTRTFISRLLYELGYKNVFIKFEESKLTKELDKEDEEDDGDKKKKKNNDDN